MFLLDFFPILPFALETPMLTGLVSCTLFYLRWTGTNFHTKTSLMFNSIPPPFPNLGKRAALEDIPPSRRQKIEPPEPSVKGKPPYNGGTMHL